MKKHFLITILLTSLTAYSQTEQQDTIPTQQLQEVIVEVGTTVETARKTILHPTRLEKRHSTNGYQLLSNMNLPDLEVNPSLKQITTLSGQNVVTLINGVEALPDELATLAANDIISIDYQRNPGGKYAGQGAVMNFITKQYEYGGNVYLNANQGFTHHYGNYLGMANHKRKALSISFTASGDWDKIRGENNASNTFLFPTTTLHQTISTIENCTDKDSQYARLKFTHAVNNHDFSVALSFNSNAVPRLSISENVAYRGLYDFNSEVKRNSEEKSLSPQLDIRYNLQLPRDQTLYLNFSSTFAHTLFHSNYSETNTNTIANNTCENYISADLGASYFKQLPKGITVGLNVAEWHKHYHDSYSGDFTSKQNLDNNFVQISATFQQSLANGLFYYADLGVSNLVSRLSDITDNHWQPVANYGVNYAINQRHSISFNGLFAHSIYDPSYKNDATIRTSFFQATIGNPNLRPLKCLQNTISYNGRIGQLRISASSSNYNYFDNNVYSYSIADETVFKQLVNDGYFSGYKVTLGLSYSMCDKHLNIGCNGLFAYLHLGSKVRPTDKCIWRGSLNATYFLGDWRFKIVYAPQRRTMSWDGVHIIDPTQYGLTVNWQRGNWALECRVENFLKRFQGNKFRADYGCYSTSSTNFTNSLGRNVSLGITYTLPYGKKTDKEDPETQTKINSAILRPF